MKQRKKQPKKTADSDFFKELEERGLLIVNKKQLLNLMIEANIKSAVDKRVKWISKKTAIAKYEVTRNWLDKAEANHNSLLRVSKGAGKTSPKKYNEQSIIEELERQSIAA